MPFRSVGSLWGKWDLHFHTPSSYDYEDKSITNEQIVDGLVAAGIVAVAITDHHLIDPKRIKALQSLGGANLTIFPAIELRSELGGKESVHLIGIFPETADPEHLWAKLQGPLGLTPAEVAKKGQTRVYVHFEEAAKLIREVGGVVSVHVGSKSNSIENIGNEHPYKQAFKEDLARDHIDLFELGQVKDQKAYREKVFPTIGYERPLVICSDNHDIRSYKLKASCWIKGDPAFVTFQQITSDPMERVYIGDVPPSVDRVRKNPTKYMKSIAFKKVPGSTLREDWFSGKLPLNPGLIAVIGNKGTGKTALAESIGLLGNTAQAAGFCFPSCREVQAVQEQQSQALHRGSKEAKQLLLNLHDEKKRELAVHEKNKPAVVNKPEADPQKQQELQAVAQQIEDKRKRRTELSTELRDIESRIRRATLDRAFADRMLGRIRNFLTQYETFIAESKDDCEQLKLDARELVKIQTDTAPLTQIRTNAQNALDEANLAKDSNQSEATALKKSIADLTEQLDAPNVLYQKYLQQLQEWEQRRNEIIGAEAESGSITYIEKQIQDYGEIPNLLKEAEADREAKTREIYGELQQLVSTYKSLYSPVQKFIKEHGLSAGKFTFEFEASITCADFADLALYQY